jgi:hypothetical protein
MSLDGIYASAIFDKDPKLRVIARLKRDVDEPLSKEIHDSRPEWEVEDLKRNIAEMRGRELPGFLKFETFAYFVRSYVALWRDKLRDAAITAAKIVEEGGTGIIEQRAFSSRNLAAQLTRELADIIDRRLNSFLTDEVDKLLDEETRPMTMNHYYMDTYNKLRLEELDQKLADWSKMPSVGLNNVTVQALVKDFFAQKMCIGESNTTQVRSFFLLLRALDAK